MSNFKEYLLSDEVKVPPDMFGAIYKYAIIFTVMVTIFELSVIFFFTRTGVKDQFKSHEKVHTT